MSQGVTNSAVDTYLTNIFADQSVGDLVPSETSPAWESVSKAGKENMNQKGGFYIVKLGSTNSAQDSQFADSEFADFPMPTNSRAIRLQVVPIVTSATVQITDHAELQDKSKYKEAPAKSISLLQEDIDGEMRFLDRKRSRQLWGDRTNEVARVSAINTTTRVLTFNAASNLFGAKFIEEGMRAEFRDTSGNLRSDGGGSPYVRFTNTNKTLVQGTYSADTPLPTGVAVSDIMYGYGDYNNAWSGIGYHTQTTGAWQGVSDRSTHDRLRGIRIDAGGASLSASLLRKMVSARRNRIDQKGKRTVGKFYASAQFDAYEASGFPQQGYGDTSGDLKRGFRRLFFSEIEFVYDPFLPYDAVFLGDLSKLHKFEMQNFAPVMNTNGSYRHRLQGADGQRMSRKQQVIFQGVGNLGTNDPAGLGVWLTGLGVSDLSLGYE